MGSKFMEARNPVRVAFGVMRERGLYFVDSLTSEASVAREMASEMTLRFAQRDQFVDDAEDRSRAAVHLANLLETRDSRSDLLLIAHPYPETVSALADAIPRFPAAGIRIVRLSELVNGRQGPPGDRPNRNRNQTP